MRITFAILPLVVFLFSCGAQNDDNYHTPVDMGIHIEGESRTFAFTNKRFAQYAGETNRSFTNGWQGWTVREKQIFQDYELYLNNTLLDRLTADVTVYPSHITREYKGSLTETFFLPDSLELACIRLTAKKGDTLTIVMQGYRGTGKAIMTDSYMSSVLGSAQPGKNLFVAAWGNMFDIKSKNGDVTMSVELDADTVNIIFLIDEVPDGVWYFAEHAHEYLALKQTRIDSLLNSIPIRSDDDDLNKAYLWAVASLDALVADQQTKGIFAGLPWFNNFWGRDTFISLPGAALVLGRFETAKEILNAFSQYQDTTETSPYYGRIPNRITLTDVIYNTTDGTPRFINQLYQYYQYTGDDAFVEKMYPVVKHAFLGALKRYVDEYGFLTHSDAETWMDAVGPDGPWSPRGSRANDIQALWLSQLRATSDFAVMMGDSIVHNKSVELIRKLELNFRNLFVDSTEALIYDHLNSDGSPDSSIRPNLFFPLTTPGLVNDYRLRLSILSRAMKELVYPYGVLSLSHLDSNFHPYHEYPPYYVKDAAYHNGIIWLWNTGVVVEALTGYYLSDIAWVLTEALTNQILNRGAVGTLAELTEAFERDGQEEVLLSGTFSQAWSLAEYIRNLYQNYFGVVPDAPNNAVYLMPALPKGLKDVEFVNYIGSSRIKVRYRFNNDIYRTIVTGESITDSLVVGIALMNRRNANYQLKTTIRQGDELIAEIPAYGESLQNLQVLKNNVKIDVTSDLYIDPDENQALYRTVRFAEPYLDPNLPALQPPDYKLLTNRQIKEENGQATELLRATDKIKDELYEYPQNYLFAEGILDFKRLTVREDDEHYYFTLEYENLVNPGWHNEYGFQLTLTSILIAADSGGNAGRIAGAGSAYTLPKERAFSYEIIVGGGIEVYNADGEKLAAYVPKLEDIKNPLGNVENKTVSFALPKSIIGSINKNTVITVLTGAQDDHGGAGIGEYRGVFREVSEWYGGGKKNPTDHNVYDIFYIN